MQAKRMVGHAPKTVEVAARLTALSGPCIGCKDCRGLCHALIEALTLPELVVRAEA